MIIKYTNEQKALINSRYIIVKDENCCMDCKHTFHDTHYFRKLSHLRNCQQQTEDSLTIIAQVHAADPSKSGSDGQPLPLAPPVKRKRKGAPEGIDPLSEQASREITDALVTFLVSTNIPFHVVESSEFKDFVDAIRPAYSAVLPTAGGLESAYAVPSLPMALPAAPMPASLPLPVPVSAPVPVPAPAATLPVQVVPVSTILPSA